MEVIALIVIGFIVYKIFDSNSSSNKEELTFTETRRVDKHGRVEVEQTLSGHVSQEHIRSAIDRSRASQKLDQPVFESPALETTSRLDRSQQVPSSRIYDTSHSSVPEHLAIETPFSSGESKKHRKQRDLKRVKSCPKCQLTKSTDEYYTTQKYSDGLSKWCKSCIDESKTKSHAKKTRNGRYKICSKCNQRREKSSFFKSTKQADGLSRWCKFCHAKNR